MITTYMAEVDGLNTFIVDFIFVVVDLIADNYEAGCTAAILTCAVTRFCIFVIVAHVLAGVLYYMSYHVRSAQQKEIHWSNHV